MCLAPKRPWLIPRVLHRSAIGSPDPGPAATRTMAPLAALGLLMALSLAALLYVTRGVTFHVTDEFIFAWSRNQHAQEEIARQ